MDDRPAPAHHCLRSWRRWIRRLGVPSRFLIGRALFALLTPTALVVVYLLLVDRSGPQPIDAAETSQLDELSARLDRLEATEAGVGRVDAPLAGRVAELEEAATVAIADGWNLIRVDANLSGRLEELDQRIDRLVVREAVVVDTVEVLVALNYTRETRQRYIEQATANSLFIPWACTEVFDLYGPPDPFNFDDDNTPLWCRLTQAFIR